MLTTSQLTAIMPLAKAKAEAFLPHLNATMDEFNIDTRLRQAAFLAQIGHESGQLRYLAEIASGEAYEGRKDLGNTFPGDGVRFKGRGLIQVTGRANYTAMMMALDVDCLEHPEIIQTIPLACRSAGWFWDWKNLNPLADKGDFLLISKRINGVNRKTGLPNGMPDRQALYDIALKVL